MRNAAVLTQNQILINHFKNTGTISGLEAMALYRVTSLTKVISNLVAAGFDITSEWRKDNTGKRYKRYYSVGARVTADDRVMPLGTDCCTYIH